MTEQGPGGSFEERLRRARERQQGSVQPASGIAPSGVIFGKGVRIASELVVSLVVSVAIGWGIDSLAGTAPAFILIFLVLGAGVGIRNLMRLARAPELDDTGAAAPTGERDGNREP